MLPILDQLHSRLPLAGPVTSWHIAWNGPSREHYVPCRIWTIRAIPTSWHSLWKSCNQVQHHRVCGIVFCLFVFLLENATKPCTSHFEIHYCITAPNNCINRTITDCLIVWITCLNTNSKGWRGYSNNELHRLLLCKSTDQQRLVHYATCWS